MNREITQNEIDIVRKIVNCNGISIDDREDVIEEVLSIAYEAEYQNKTIENFNGWLFVVTKHVINKYFNDKHRREGQLCKLNESLEEYDAKGAFFACKNDIIDEEITSLYVWEKVCKLDGCAPRILKMYYADGYRIKEIASILKLNENTVKTIKQRALQRLKEMMQEEGGEEYEHKGNAR